MNLIPKNNLVNEVYNQLLQMLATGEYPEGSKLPSETQLCEALGVSRNTVRTAISKLIALGLVFLVRALMRPALGSGTPAAQ